MILDYLQSPKKRELFIVGSKGSLNWDYYKDEIMINYYNNKSKRFKYDLPNRNELFLREIKYFFNSIKNNNKIESDFFHAYKCLDIAEKIKKSIKINKVVKI